MIGKDILIELRTRQSCTSIKYSKNLSINLHMTNKFKAKDDSKSRDDNTSNGCRD